MQRSWKCTYYIYYKKKKNQTDSYSNLFVVFLGQCAVENCSNAARGSREVGAFSRRRLRVSADAGRRRSRWSVVCNWPPRGRPRAVTGSRSGRARGRYRKRTNGAAEEWFADGPRVADWPVGTSPRHAATTRPPTGRRRNHAYARTHTRGARAHLCAAFVHRLPPGVVSAAFFSLVVCVVFIFFLGFF